MNFTWNVTSMTSRYMTLFINFTNPEKISRSGTDMMTIIFMQNGRFIEVSTGKPIANDYTVVFSIPK